MRLEENVQMIIIIIILTIIYVHKHCVCTCVCTCMQNRTYIQYSKHLNEKQKYIRNISSN